MSTNHKAASDRIMDALNEDWVSQEGQTDTTAIVTALDALRHATLAQVEATDALAAKQHTANQIAWHAQGKAGPQVRDQIDAAVNL